MKYTEHIIKGDELQEPKKYLGHLFKNGSKVYSILNNIEDIIKSNAYFDAYPVRVTVVDNDGNFLRDLSHEEKNDLVSLGTLYKLTKKYLK